MQAIQSDRGGLARETRLRIPSAGTDVGLNPRVFIGSSGHNWPVPVGVLGSCSQVVGSDSHN